ncbi:sigma-70 family RNA polymerase sigma factor [Actinoplanes sp. Pm04-4]|uniref:Sigma-70 family RNA polymerase sigma factor n=1 Tax=Paractinoplanes pyxinae TaxID=2997416 RepID=A0ABT4AQB4_9ACTN|nr:sigma-70 family RNA polymerase sigma factor [Actinoplanes pyxinae]MCY1136439.1 sigma-70 family RNA polymerase sigma factor [Actinoplanes pyxinae]
MSTSTVPLEPEALADFESVRSRLFGIAYRRLGRAVEAEDVVQDVWVRWQGADREPVRNRVAFLTTITTRVALNAATSAYARHEIHAGGWLPDLPVESADPALEAERAAALQSAVQLLAERLTPAERAVYVLREAFGYPFSQIAKLLGLNETRARQLAVRARRHLTERRRNTPDPAERDELLEAFREAARGGGMTRLTDLLAAAVRTSARPGAPVASERRGPAGVAGLPRTARPR